MITDPDHSFFKPSKEQTITFGPRDPEATALIEDLSKTLEEYQEVEKKLSDMAKEDSPAQKQLRSQLVKIRLTNWLLTVSYTHLTLPTKA